MNAAVGYVEMRKSARSGCSLRVAKALTVFFALACLAFSAQAADIDCTSATTRVERIICTNEELSKLDVELARAYFEALTKSKTQDALKAAQGSWLLERDNCAAAGSPESCLRYQFRKRIIGLQKMDAAPVSSKTATKAASTRKPKGEFFLSRVNDTSMGLCRDFTRNLNQFRHLNFNECDPRLSPKYPQFSRPQWEQIPLDLSIAETVVRHHWVDQSSPQADQEWQDWLKWSEPLRHENKVELRRTHIDFDGDGNRETIVRLFPEVAENIRNYPKLPYGCNYIKGYAYMLEKGSANPKVVKEFDRISPVDDVIYDYASDAYYILDWNSTGPAMGVILPGPGPDIGATSGVTLTRIVPVLDVMHMSTDCLIDWVPTGQYKPPKKPVNRSHE